jgi:hypothetical protein
MVSGPRRRHDTGFDEEGEIATEGRVEVLPAQYRSGVTQQV